ncbi:MAG TPA: GNAT family N-acetyltransferase [Candidatus Babeliales bacterium]|jgi:predicted GNAT family acetyltransferase|nr:GNAT family N-acetyltransferase [Candidatus Babeliales bacterium]
MKSKCIIKLTILSLSFIAQCCEFKFYVTPQGDLYVIPKENHIIIRPATSNDLLVLEVISNEYYQNNFKSVWEKNYSSITPSQHTIDTFIKEKERINRMYNISYTNKQTSSEKSDQKLLVAELIHAYPVFPLTRLKKEDATARKIVGSCRFEKKDQETIRIDFVVVAQEFRKNGIAKKLIENAIKSFDDVTECTFRTLIFNDFSNDFYIQHGCAEKGSLSLNPNTEQPSRDPYAPITHIDYSYAIKK